MKRKNSLNLDELVGSAEIAERLGVQQKTVWLWGQRGKLPQPITVIGRARIWEWVEVEEWAARTGRLNGKHKGGRPKKRP